MGQPVKRRKYDSPRRKAQARQTRREIMRAAHELFVDRGYGNTTMRDIAKGAGVAIETVYAVFGSKTSLLKNVWDFTIGGDDEEIAFHERPEVLEMRTEKDPARRLEMYASLVAHNVAPRTAPFIISMRGAAGSEPEAQAMLNEMDRQRLNGMTLAAAELGATAGLAVTEDEARDILWATNPGELWYTLVEQRGWDRDRFAAWLANMWKRMLLKPKYH